MSQGTTARPPVRSFGQPPPGYVAGLGRGAVGFTTRSDIGPAKVGPTREDRYAAVRGSSNAALVMSGLGPTPSREEDLSESNFDAFAGYGGSLFDASTPYDAEDREADNIYDAVDAKMEERRAAYKARRAVADHEEQLKKRPKLQDQFADLKRQLGTISEEEWLNIPEPADLSKQNKRSSSTRSEIFTPVPDSIIASSISSTQHANALDATLDGVETPISAATPLPSDLMKLGQARYKVLGIKLDKMSDSVTGQTVVNPRDFLTDLRSVTTMNDAEVSDIKKARTLLKSVTATNPHHPPGWLCAARLEEAAGRMSVARKLIMKACEACPDSQDVWLEAARLHPPAEAKSILARAVTAVPTSVKVWMSAVRLEEDDKAKRAVLRRALELVPTSVRLWKAAIELEEPDDARVLLSYAVECVPESVEMWLALARLETYENAKKVLNRARAAVPTDPSIWITAAQLEEANGSYDRIDVITQKAVKSLAAKGVVIDREQWLREAEASEKSGSPLTCQAIVRATLGLGVEQQDRRATWTADAQAALANGSVVTARAIMAQTLLAYPSKVDLWWDAAQLEKHHGTHESLMAVLHDAVKHVPESEVLWLMTAKEQWMAGDLDGARRTLDLAFEANPNSEEIWLAAVKMESENGEYERARALLSRARSRAPGARVWIKSAKMERELGIRDNERSLIRDALQRFPTAWKLWAMAIQNDVARGDVESAAQTCRDALASCPTSVELWLVTSRFHADHVSVAKARADLEIARKRIPGNDRLWLEAIRIEERDDTANSEVQHQAAVKLMSRALQECPQSGILWAKAIELEPRPKRRGKSYDALKKCSFNAHVFIAVARLFWQDRKIKKARNWFERAVTADPDLGDAWAFFYRFISSYCDEGEREAVLNRCEEADPHHGELWCAVSKAVGDERLKARGICVKVASTLPEGFL
ncbi:unnamed protein product (mitochondrion) [Plasmodiophora brassicae]|uniref:PRP1 splicing factor N-terminal domain-containing protein n=1 Tax=Plasmodiophora brassicae TaxID=37360 RepID=A0A0G4J4S4_PLABS|nr:hypothetical protein PBRA_009159 [Plasmodiophora brassicae]SPQ98454.1 unnamed protein product [Plasmodiophora brassicae]